MFYHLGHILWIRNLFEFILYYPRPKIFISKDSDVSHVILGFSKGKRGTRWSGISFRLCFFPLL